jgi:putative transposase
MGNFSFVHIDGQILAWQDWMRTDSGIICSMSRAGNVWDNAAMENVFSSLKTERTARKNCRTRNEAKADVFDLSSGSTIPPTALDDRMRQPG